ncbi:hypothetical protein PJN38_24390 [Mycobacterium kansasii]
MIPDIEIGRYALRTFNVDREARTLRSLMVPGDHWAGGTCVAQCLRSEMAWGLLRPPEAVERQQRPHETPSDGDCGCGIYGCLNVASLVRQYGLQAERLIAVIAAEGATIIGDTGLRTSAARVVAYWTPDRDVRKICAETCCGAEYYADLKGMLSAYKFRPAAHSLLPSYRGSWVEALLIRWSRITDRIGALLIE